MLSKNLKKKLIFEFRYTKIIIKKGKLKNF